LDPPDEALVEEDVDEDEPEEESLVVDDSLAGEDSLAGAEEDDPFDALAEPFEARLSVR
jgi:hypothetical protein